MTNCKTCKKNISPGHWDRHVKSQVHKSHLPQNKTYCKRCKIYIETQNFPSHRLTKTHLKKRAAYFKALKIAQKKLNTLIAKRQKRVRPAKPDYDIKVIITNEAYELELEETNGMDDLLKWVNTDQGLKTYYYHAPTSNMIKSFTLSESSIEAYIEKLDQWYKQQKHTFKVNFLLTGLGKEGDNNSWIDPARNTALFQPGYMDDLPDTPQVIASKKDWINFKSLITIDNLRRILLGAGGASFFQPVAVTQLHFEAYMMKQPMGASVVEVPQDISASKGLYALEKVQDNMCFF